ncbi:hypothetical protein HDV04_002739 [Boothiomyces sp. JEL0838]|nr:hypothetical protein HDV04_002739 [Boothiomyces sp. JEL0838]
MPDFNQVFELLQDPHVGNLQEIMALIKLSPIIHSQILMIPEFLQELSMLLMDESISIYDESAIFNTVLEIVKELITITNQNETRKINTLINKRNCILIVKHPINIIGVLGDLMSFISSKDDFYLYSHNIILILDIIQEMISIIGPDSYKLFNEVLFAVEFAFIKYLFSFYTSQIEDLPQNLFKKLLTVYEAIKKDCAGNLTGIFKPILRLAIINLDCLRLTDSEPLLQYLNSKKIESISIQDISLNQETSLKLILGYLLENHHSQSFSTLVSNLENDLMSLFLKIQSKGTKVDEYSMMITLKIKQSDKIILNNIQRILNNHIIKNRSKIFIRICEKLNSELDTVLYGKGIIIWHNLCQLLAELFPIFQQSNLIPTKIPELENYYATNLKTLVKCTTRMIHKIELADEISPLIRFTVNSILSPFLVSIFQNYRNFHYLSVIFDYLKDQKYLNFCTEYSKSSINLSVNLDLKKLTVLPEIGKSNSLPNLFKRPLTPDFNSKLLETVYQVFTTILDIVQEYTTSLIDLFDYLQTSLVNDWICLKPIITELSIVLSKFKRDQVFQIPIKSNKLEPLDSDVYFKPKPPLAPPTNNPRHKLTSMY